ncbi:hypothetical protein K1719_040627 [Acacia pycnantha]|nr:hypothetical protein K1719_040627 [Acacia pycnantha]
MDEKVPLVIPEVNPEAMENIKLGMAILNDCLTGSTMVIRNEALLLLTHLIHEAEEIQKIVVFEGAFEKIFSIIKEEGGSDGGVVVQDCLELLNNLLRNNGSNRIIEQIVKIEEQSKTSKSCFSGICPNCVNRYRISRKSTKKVRSITELQEQVGNLNWISRPAPLPGIEYSSSRNFIAFDLRIEPTDRILNALEEDECHAVVLHKTRGIGKTELAKDVGRRAKEESEFGRTRRPCLRLKIEEKILIIFDHVREKLDLKAMGIPLDNKGCKMIVTENENLWKSTEDGVKKVEIQALSEEESWRLFKSVTEEIVGK